MPLAWAARPLKRWRYIGFYGDEVMLFMVRFSVGPLRQCFWSLWDRMEDLVITDDALPKDLSANKKHLKGYGQNRSD